jgi:hypothetical protein
VLEVCLLSGTVLLGEFLVAQRTPQNFSDIGLW